MSHNDGDCPGKLLASGIEWMRIGHVVRGVQVQNLPVGTTLIETLANALAQRVDLIDTVRMGPVNEISGSPGNGRDDTMLTGLQEPAGNAPERL